jgi:hypothetical protein
MPVLRTIRLVLLAAVALLAATAGTASAAPRMPIGFFDDNNFRWSDEREAWLRDAQVAGASVIHTTVNWATMAPQRPANAADGDDPAYHISDLDELVRNAGRFGLRVMIDITGSPKWANGGGTPNTMPRRLADFTAFAKMLANRYDGTVEGQGYVGLWSVWNEPNIELFLKPQYVGKKIVSPSNYVKLYKSAYAGIKAGNPRAQVAIGETSARGRDIPKKGVSATVAPGTFARLVARAPGLKFDAWAHHPYPTSPNLPPLQKVRWPNVTLSQMPKFESSLDAWFHRRNIPVWITEYGHETKPGEPHGVTNAKQAAYARQALTIARADKRVQMFVWFTIKDTPGNPWQSGLYGRTGSVKPAYAAFSSLARLIDGDGTYTVRAGTQPTVKFYPALLRFFSAPGETIGMTLRVFNNGKLVTSAQPTAPMGFDGSVTVRAPFSPAKGKTYTVTAELNDPHGNHQTRSVAVIAS